MDTKFTFHKKRLFFGLLILLIGCVVVMQALNTPLKNEVCEQGIVSYELAQEVASSISILNSWSPETKITVGLNLGFDFLFILIYVSFFLLLAYTINNRLWKDTSFYKYGKIILFLVISAGVSDIIENFALIKLLTGSLEQTWSSMAYYFAKLKFGLLLVVIIYLIINWGILLVKGTRKK